MNWPLNTVTRVDHLTQQAAASEFEVTDHIDGLRRKAILPALIRLTLSTYITLRTCVRFRMS